MDLVEMNKKYLEENPRSTIVPDIKQPPINDRYRRTIHAIEEKLSGEETTVFTDFFPLRHSFSEGVYVRELFIPKGYIVIGKIHPVSYASFFMSGDVTMYTEEGVKRMKAPLAVISPAWTKRMSYSHSDMIWVTVHPNPDNIRNIEELEKIIHADSFEGIKVEVSDDEVVEVMDYFIDKIKDTFDPKKFRELIPSSKKIPYKEGGVLCQV